MARRCVSLLAAATTFFQPVEPSSVVAEQRPEGYEPTTMDLSEGSLERKRRRIQLGSIFIVRPASSNYMLMKGIEYVSLVFIVGPSASLFHNVVHQRRLCPRLEVVS